MADSHTAPIRPERIKNAPLPDLPTPDLNDAEKASTEFSHYRTGLSHHRTELSEHRTDLSEFRTDLSSDRTELSMRRTGMSIQRTRMSADRTLMSVIRTSLSLIGFGFTVHEAFKKAIDAGAIEGADSAKSFGIGLILIGILILIGGIFRHVQFSMELRGRRKGLIHDELLHGESKYPVSITLLSAVALLLLGVFSIVSIALNLDAL